MALKRSIGVILRLHNDQYKREAREAARATDDIGDSARGASADLDELGESMSQVGRQSEEMNQRVGRSLTSGMRMRGYLGIIGGVVGAVAAPAIGAAVAGAVVGAVGLGGIAGGIAAAAQDPAVKQAADGFMGTLREEWAEVGDAFAVPTIRALDTLKSTLVRVDLEGVFAPAADHVERFAEGVGDFVEELSPGLRTALANAGPFVDAIAEGLGDVGRELGGMFADLSQNEGAVQGLADAFTLLAGGIELTSELLGDLSAIWDTAGPLMLGITGFMSPTQMMHFLSPITQFLGPGPVQGTLENIGEVDAFAAAEERVATNAWLMDAALGAATDEVYSLLEGFERLNGAELDAREANRDVEQSLDDLREALDESNGSLDITNEKGRAAEAALDDVAEGAAKARQAVWDQTGSIEAANLAYDNYIGQLRDILIESGMAEAAVDELIGRIAAVPSYKGIDIQFRITATTPIGASNYWALYGEQLARRAVMGMRHGGIIAAADGLLQADVVSSPTVLFGERETGGEAFIPRLGNRDRSLSILSQAAGWHGAAVVPQGMVSGPGGGARTFEVIARWDRAPDGPIARAVQESLRFDVVERAGGSVQDRYGQRGRVR